VAGAAFTLNVTGISPEQLAAARRRRRVETATRRDRGSLGDTAVLNVTRSRSSTAIWRPPWVANVAIGQQGEQQQKDLVTQAHRGAPR